MFASARLLAGAARAVPLKVTTVWEAAAVAQAADCWAEAAVAAATAVVEAALAAAVEAAAVGAVVATVRPGMVGRGSAASVTVEAVAVAPTMAATPVPVPVVAHSEDVQAAALHARQRRRLLAAGSAVGASFRLASLAEIRGRGQTVIYCHHVETRERNLAPESLPYPEKVLLSKCSKAGFNTELTKRIIDPSGKYTIYSFLKKK